MNNGNCLLMKEKEVTPNSLHILLFTALSIERKAMEKYVLPLNNSRKNLHIQIIPMGVGCPDTKLISGLLNQISPVTLAVSVGLAGAVATHLKVFDTVIPEQISFEHSPATKCFDKKLLSWIERVYHASPLPIKLAPLAVQVGRLYGEAEKCELLQIHPTASCIDMESAKLVEQLNVYGIPVLIVRTISDALGTDVSVLTKVESVKGKKNRRYHLFKLIVNPRILFQLLKLYFICHRAARINALVIRYLLDKLSEEQYVCENQ